MESGFNSADLLSLLTFAYFGASLLYLGLLVFKKQGFGRVGTWVTFVAVVANTGGIIWRWVESYQMGIGRPPFSNLYESLVLFSWAIAAVYLVMERLYKNRAMGAFVVPLAFLSLAYASLKPSAIEPLVPALKSTWLIAHVITCFLGYAGFALAAGLGLMYLIKQWTQGTGVWGMLPTVQILDNLIYQNIVIGFILLTAGIITGSIWAHQAWGSYWSWDPKETWSLITWFIYAAILHARMVRGWQGMRIAVMAMVGFGCVLFTYFGVNNLLPGLHSYATGK